MKSSYAIITNIFERVKVDYGDDYTQWEGSKYTIGDFDFLYATYFEPYVQTFNKRRGNICEVYKCASEYKTLKGLNMYQHGWSGSFYLKNGAFIHIHPFHCGADRYSDMLYIDINGPEHGPNILGRDVFDYFLRIGKSSYSNKKGIVATQCQGMSRDEILKRCNKDFDGKNCSQSGCYSCCAELIMHDSWQIKNDYPW